MGRKVEGVEWRGSGVDVEGHIGRVVGLAVDDHFALNKEVVRETRNGLAFILR